MISRTCRNDNENEGGLMGGFIQNLVEDMLVCNSLKSFCCVILENAISQQKQFWTHVLRVKLICNAVVHKPFISCRYFVWNVIFR